MTIGEANAVNELLCWLLRVPLYGQVSTECAREQAAWLADRANKALSAGLTGERVNQLWRQRRA